MAVISLKYPVFAPLTESGGSATYAGGKEIGKAISANISVDILEGVLYANGAAAESVKRFKSGTVDLNVDEIGIETAAELLGHTLESAGITGKDDLKMLVARGDDEGPNVGVGFYGPSKVNDADVFRAVWLTKVKFGIPQQSFETSGESINFQTPSISGTVMLDATGTWKKEITVPDEADAVAWLQGLAGITPPAPIA